MKMGDTILYQQVKWFCIGWILSAICSYIVMAIIK